MIELQHFSIGYKENSLLHEVNATIKKGQLTALIGRNGTGKSTLLRAIAGLNRCYSGKIILDGHDIACMKYEGENETYIEASAENSGSTLYDKEIRDKPRTRHTKRNV